MPAPLQIKLAPRRRYTMNASEAQTGQKNESRISPIFLASACWKASGTGHSWKHPMQRTRRCSHFYRASEL